MSAVVVCPECGATTSVEADAPRTGTIPCRQCGIQLPVPAAAEPKPGGPPPLPALPKPAASAGGPPPVPPLPKPVAAAAGDFEVLDDVDDDDDGGRPAVGRRSRDDDDEDDDRPRRRDRDDEDDDEDDRRPARSRSRDDEDDRPRRHRDDDDEEDEDDRRRPAARDRDEDDEDDDRPRRVSRDDDDEEEDEDDRRRPAARGRDDDEDEDDEEDRPRRRPADDEDEEVEAPVAKRRLRPDEEDEEEEEEEEEEERPKSKKGLVILLVLLFLGVVGAGGVIAAYVFLFDKEPDKTVAQGNAGDGDGHGPGPVGPNPAGPGPRPKGVEPKIEPKTPKLPAIWKGPDRPLGIQPPLLQNDRKTVTLPGVVADVCAGGDGRYLFLHCPDEKKLLAFDTSKAEVVKEFETEGKDARFAAGATKLLLFGGVVRTLQRIDLVTLEKDKEVPLPAIGAIKDIALGSGSRGPALVLTDSPADAWPVHFLDLDTLEPADVGWTAAPAADLPRDLRFKSSANGARWVGTSDAKDAKGAVVVFRDGKALSATRVLPDQALGFAALSHNGNLLLTRAGTFTVLRQSAPKEIAKPAGEQYSIPATTGSIDVQVQGGDAPETLQLTYGSRIRGGVQKTVNGVPVPLGTDEPGSPAQLIQFVPDALAVFVVQPTRKKVEVVRFDPFVPNPKTIWVTSTPPDRFTPGKPYVYPIRALTNATNVTFGAGTTPGLTIQTMPDGTLKWDVPADEKREFIQFTAIVRGDGSQNTQTIRAFNAAAPAPKPGGTTEPKKEPMPKSPDPKVPAITAGAKLVQPATHKVPIPAAPTAGPHQEVALPGQARDVCVGGGGRYLVFHIPSARKLVMFDVCTLKVEKTLSLPSDDLMFAAGMDKLAVYYPAEKTLVRYAVDTLKAEGDAPLETIQRPTFLAMGSGTWGPLILGNIPAQNNATKMALTFLDLETLKEVKIDKAEGEFQVTTATAAHLRVSTDGSTLGLWRAQLVPSGVQIARLEGNSIKGSYQNESAGEVSPGPDGQKVYTEKGAFDLDGKPTDPKGTVVPAVQGAGYIALTTPSGGKRQVAVWGSAKDKPLATFDDLPGFDGKTDPFERNNPNLSLDRRLFWVPDAGVLIVVSPAADKVHVYAVKK